MDKVIQVGRASYNAYELKYSDEVLLQPESASNISNFEAQNAISDDLFTLDDPKRWLQEPIDPHPSVDSLQRWKLHQYRFPVLRYIGFNHLAAPVSSSASYVLDEDRCHTSDELVEAYQLPKSQQYQDLLDKLAIQTAALDTEVIATAAILYYGSDQT